MAVVFPEGILRWVPATEVHCALLMVVPGSRRGEVVREVTQVDVSSQLVRVTCVRRTAPKTVGPTRVQMTFLVNDLVAVVEPWGEQPAPAY